MRFLKESLSKLTMLVSLVVVENRFFGIRA
jgi:hypothetical protein